MKTSTQVSSRSNKRVYHLKQSASKTQVAELEAKLDGETLGPKTVITRPPVTPSEPLHSTERPTPAPGRSVIKLGMDVDMNGITVCTQYDYSTIKPAAGFTPETLVAWVKQRVEEGHVVWTVYEACGFGYTLHFQLKQAGAHSLVIAPIKLDTQRQRKNDKLDARALCTRLTRYLDGQKTELPIIRVPSVEEQQRRETGRQREFWRSQVQRLASHGRALRLEHEHRKLPGRWWTERNWKKLTPELSLFVRQTLEALRFPLLYSEQQVATLTEQLEARIQGPLPMGLGALTMALFEGEMCNVGRFSNRKQVGSFIGCCPSEYASGVTSRMGGIDRHGNKHLRAILVEAAWRMLRYQPGWDAYRHLVERLKAGAAIRKKTAIALARRLAIDLWRVKTGRATWEDLGFVVK